MFEREREREREGEREGRGEGGRLDCWGRLRKHVASLHHTHKHTHTHMYIIRYAQYTDIEHTRVPTNKLSYAVSHPFPITMAHTTCTSCTSCVWTTSQHVQKMCIYMYPFVPLKQEIQL